MPDPNTVQPAQRPELNDHRSAGSGRQPARIDRERLAALRRAEALEFERRTPRSPKRSWRRCL